MDHQCQRDRLVAGALSAVRHRVAEPVRGPHEEVSRTHFLRMRHCGAHRVCRSDLRGTAATAAADLPRTRRARARRRAYVNMEGPAFSTRSESMTHHNLGYDVIGMTN